MRSGRQATLLLFWAGGVRFAVEAASVRQIAPRDWCPPVVQDGAAEARSVSLAKELGLRDVPSERTLVVDAQGGTWGFRVDAIESEVLGEFDVYTVPQLLASWMDPVVICGLTDGTASGEIIHVLDLRLLVHHLESKDGQGLDGMPQ